MVTQQLKIHYIQHVPFEGLGCIEQWIEEKAYHLSVTRVYEKPAFPDPDSIDWLIVMGGPMGVYQEEDFSWLRTEKQFIKQMIELDKVVIGICLGSQLIAEVLGASVYPNKEKEIGWFPIYSEKAVGSSLLFGDKEDSFTVFHWHGDTFDLPANAICLAKTDVTPNQAFSYKNNVLGLQFHLEVTERGVRDMFIHCKNDLAEYSSASVQNENMILKPNDSIQENNRKMFSLLDRINRLNRL